MSYIPDCRTDENYNEKYLNEKDKEFLLGFDWAIESAVDNFFDNNFCMPDYDDSYISHVLTHDVPDFMKEKYTMEYTFGDRDEENREVKTYADWIRMKILEWIEIKRNTLITSMLDNMDEEEYKRIKEKVDGRQSKAEN